MPRFTPALPLALLLASTVGLSAVATGAWALTEPGMPPAPTGATSRAAPLELPADPAVRTGVLANGMRYEILRNTTPKGQAALRLRIGSGSLQETDAQQGLAHFLEHMAFKGSTHVPGNEMVKILQRKGLAFGPDTNAFTAWTETVYMLDLPETDKDTLDTGLMLMRETAGELTLDPAAVAPERGVVLSEERVRDTPGYRAAKAKLTAQLETQLAARRFPIGQVEVIKTAPASELARFYQANYRPDRTTLIVVGDVDPAAIEAQIVARFSDWKAKGPATAEPDLGTVTQRPARTQLLIIPGAANTIEMSWLKPFDASPDGPARRARDTIDGLALAVLNRRLEKLSRGDHPPFLSAGSGDESLFRSADVTSVQASTSPDRWRDGVTALVTEVRRLTEFGVLPDELKRELVDTRTNLVNEVAGAPTRRTPDLASELVTAVDEQRIFTTPQTDLTAFDILTAKLTVEDVNRAARRLFSGSGPLLQMNAPAVIEGGEPALAKAFAAASEAKVEAPVRQADVSWPYQSFGTTPGKVLKTTAQSDLGITQVLFSNGVALTVKPTKFKTDEVQVSVRIGHGRSAFPADRPNVAWAAQALPLSGLRLISQEDMERILNGRTFDARFEISDSGLFLHGVTKPADLAVQMQVLAAYATDTGWRPEAFERLKVALANALPQFEATALGVLSRDSMWLTTNHDSRFRYPDAAGLQSLKMDDLREVLMPQMSGGPVEVTIVGDLTEAQAVDVVARTFGAMPPRPVPSLDAARAAVRPVHFPEAAAGAPPTLLHHNGRADQAVALVAWPIPDIFTSPRLARTLTLTQDILANRLLDEVRVRQGATYSPMGEARPSDVYSGFGYIIDYVETPPDKLDSFFKAVTTIAADLRSKPPTADEVTRAVTPRVEQVLKAQQTNGYWLSRLSTAYGDPRTLDLIRTILPDLRAITPKDVQTATQTYLTDAKLFRLEITSTATAGPTKP